MRILLIKCKIMAFSLVGLTIAAILVLLLRIRPVDYSATCQQFYAQMKNPPASAVTWCNEGKYINWKSTLPENSSFGELDIFTACLGDKTSPAVVMIHGYPTSSYDFHNLADQLRSDVFVCALDTPGYGFSDKPRNGYRYSIFDDARLADYFIRDVVGLKDLTLLTHDKGDSVGLALLQVYQTYETRPYTINQHIITNGNIYLPLAHLSTGQKLLLNPISGPLLSALSSGSLIAKRLAGLTYTLNCRKMK